MIEKPSPNMKISQIFARISQKQNGWGWYAFSDDQSMNVRTLSNHVQISWRGVSSTPFSSPFLIHLHFNLSSSLLTSDSKKLWQSTVLYHHCGLSQFFLNQTLPLFATWMAIQIITFKMIECHQFSVPQKRWRQKVPLTLSKTLPFAWH